MIGGFSTLSPSMGRVRRTMDNHQYPLVATRRYYAGPSSEDCVIVVSIRQSFKDDTGYCECAYQFDGAEQRTRSASGIDELGALINALAMIGTDLEHLNRQKYGGRLRWVGGAADSSLPTIRS